MDASRLLPHALTLLLLTAGCAAPAKLEAPAAPMLDPEPELHYPYTVGWGLSECRALVSIARVPSSAVAPHLPSGFRSLSYSELTGTGAPSPPGDANFGVEMFECRAGQGLNGTVTDASYGSVFSFVEPPAHLLNKSHPFHVVKWDVLISDPAQRALLREHGVPAQDGTAQFVRFQRQGDLTLYQGSMMLGAGGAYLLDGATGAQFVDAHSFDEFTPTKAGLVSWWGRFGAMNAKLGAGTLKAPAGSFAAKVLGTSNEVQVALFGGTIGGLVGEVTLVGRAPLDPAPVHEHRQ